MSAQRQAFVVGSSEACGCQLNCSAAARPSLTFAGPPQPHISAAFLDLFLAQVGANAIYWAPSLYTGRQLWKTDLGWPNWNLGGQQVTNECLKMSLIKHLTHLVETSG